MLFIHFNFNNLDDINLLYNLRLIGIAYTLIIRKVVTRRARLVMIVMIVLMNLRVEAKIYFTILMKKRKVMKMIVMMNFQIQAIGLLKVSKLYLPLEYATLTINHVKQWPTLSAQQLLELEEE